MIHIFVNNNYSKETLGDLLNYINTTVDRELTYGINTDYDNKDVVVEISNYIDKEDMMSLSSLPQFKDDLCIFAGKRYCTAFANGESDTVRNYVEEME